MRGPRPGAPVKLRVRLCQLFLALEDGRSADSWSNYRDKDGRPVNYSGAPLRLTAPDPERSGGVKSPPSWGVDTERLMQTVLFFDSGAAK